MTQTEFENYLMWAAIGCTVAAVINVFMVKKRGNRAFLMATSFLFFGAALYVYRIHAPVWAVGLCGFGVFGCLVTDIVMRMRGQEHRS